MKKEILLSIMLIACGISGILQSLEISEIERDRDFWHENSDRNLEQIADCLSDRYLLEDMLGIRCYKIQGELQCEDNQP